MQSNVITAAAWHSVIRGAATDAPAVPRRPYRVALIADSPPDVRQPPLLDDIVCLHRAGAKRVHRTCGGRATAYDVANGAVTVMPRGQANGWRTEGPIDYIHIVPSPKAFDRIIAEEFDRDRATVELHDRVGMPHPLLRRLAEELAWLARPDADAGRLYLEGVFTTFVVAMLRASSSVAVSVSDDLARTARASGGLTGWRLRRTLDYLDAHRQQDIGYDELTELVGLSRAHFFRAFKQSTGTSPGRYVEDIKLGDARLALVQGKSLETAATLSGFAGAEALSRAFRRKFGISPTAFLKWYR